MRGADCPQSLVDVCGRHAGKCLDDPLVTPSQKSEISSRSVPSLLYLPSATDQLAQTPPLLKSSVRNTGVPHGPAFSDMVAAAVTTNVGLLEMAT